MAKKFKYLKSYAEFHELSLSSAELQNKSDDDSVLNVCVDRPKTIFSTHARMWNAIKHNPNNMPENLVLEKKEVLESFLENPTSTFSPNEASMLTEMALTTKSKWQAGTVLNISFIDGTNIQKQKTIQMANEWLQYADIKFNFLGIGSNGVIRISFNSDPGSWSYIGTDCMTIPTTQPTMNFGWLRDDTVDDEWRRVVVHEFGHALGCIHEHQNPAGGIQWNKPAVYQYYEGPPNNWSQAEVDSNIFQTYAIDQTQFTALDPNSIMMYPIPAAFTLDGFSVGMNIDLSTTDKSFIKQQYP